MKKKTVTYKRKPRKTIEPKSRIKAKPPKRGNLIT